MCFRYPVWLSNLTGGTQNFLEELCNPQKKVRSEEAVEHLVENYAYPAKTEIWDMDGWMDRLHNGNLHQFKCYAAFVGPSTVYPLKLHNINFFFELKPVF